MSRPQKRGQNKDEIPLRGICVLSEGPLPRHSPPSVVMKWTGHSDYKAMKPDIDIVDSIKAESMTQFNNLF